MRLQPIRTTLAGQRQPVLPTGVVVPDLTIKRSLVLDGYNLARRQARARQHLQQLQAQRGYEGAAFNRLTSDWMAHNTSADAELAGSLRQLRDRSRQLVRDNPHAKHAVRVITNNVVGTGIRMQAMVANARGTLQTRLNDNIEAAWADWSQAKSCHTAGLLAFPDIERVVMFQLVTAGEAIIRKHRVPFGPSRVPLALEVIEADRLLDQWQVAKAPNGNTIRQGVEIDEWHRPVAYWFAPKHPGDLQYSSFVASKYLRVPAEDIIHLYLIDRWPQTRGEPWFHAALRSMHDSGGTEEAIVVKARASANVVGFIRGGDPLPGGADEAQAAKASRQLVDTEPGTWQKLLPGEDVTGYPTAAPDPSLEPFLRYLLRKQATAVGLTYETYTNDFSQSNYSSSRLGQFSERDCYRALQGYLVRTLRLDVHVEFMNAAVLVGELKAGEDYFSNPGKYQAVRFRPRGWTTIDPAKEIPAYRAAVRAGFMTNEDVIAQVDPNGDDHVDLVRRRQQEVQREDEAGLVFDTNPAKVNDKGQPVGSTGGQADTEPEDEGSGDGEGTGQPADDGEGQPNSNGETE